MKRAISRLFNSAPKRFAAAAIVALALFLPVSSLAADAVSIEGAIGVANVTKGDTQYKSDVDASFEDTVKVEVYYHNRENPDSGKIAENLRVKIGMPTTPGVDQVVRTTIKADNSNTIEKSANVHLNRNDASLEYIPGSAVWKHNIGTNENIQTREDKISDAIVTDGQGLVLENEKPCFNFSATVTILARVRVPSVSITKKVRQKGTGTAVTQMDAKSGDHLEYLITAKNLGNTDLNNVVLRDALPAQVMFVPGTVKLFNGPNPSGVVINNDSLFKGGVNAGTMGPGATVFITFEADVKATEQLQCGVNSIKNIAVVDTDQTGEYNNNATVTVSRECKEVPSFSCDLLTLKQLGDRKIEASVQQTAKNGATFKDVSFNFGDGTPALLTNKTTVDHTYAKDGDYTVAATVRFTVDGQVKSVSSENCAKPVSFKAGQPVTPTTPEQPGKPTALPDTGAGDVLGIFFATSIAGALAYRFVWLRRFAQV